MSSSLREDCAGISDKLIKAQQPAAKGMVASNQDRSAADGQIMAVCVGTTCLFWIVVGIYLTSYRLLDLALKPSLRSRSVGQTASSRPYRF